MIVVTAPASVGRVQPPSVVLGADGLIDRQPRSIADAVRGLPGVSVRPNSRGELVPRIRGAEERQTQVFLDGAPLSVPWDGRINLGLIPAGVIGRLDVKKGAVPIEYGANAVAGVIDLQSRRGGENGFTAVAQAGTFGLANLSGVLTTGIGGAELTVAMAHQSVDAQRVADLAALPFSQADSRRRTNTKADTNSFFSSLAGEVGGVALNANILHFRSDLGIAPESDRDPAVFAPRFWRYPDINYTRASVSAEVKPADEVTIRAVGWRQWFGQTIDAYRTVAYDSLRSREENDDDTLGGRLTLTHPAGPLTLRWSASAQQADHIQTDTTFPFGIAGTDLKFRQNLFSFGGEADLKLAAMTRVTVGLGYDKSTNPRTGDKPAQPDTAAMAISGAISHQFDDDWSLTVSGGRRTRFASARELFGEAQGRFLANPGLLPETAWLADAELRWRREGVTVTINPFLIRTDNSIVQKIVSAGGAALRQRVNVTGSTAYGADALMLMSLRSDLTVELTGTILHASADEGTTAFERLVQRPDHEVMLALDWSPDQLFDIRGELRRIGAAVDLAPDGTEARLPPATEVNLRASMPMFRFGANTWLKLTAAVDNLFDAVVLPQLGLPMAGRTLRFGILVQ